MASTAPTGIDLRQFSPGRARSICSMGTPGCLDSRLPACLAMVGPIRRAGRRPGPGLHGLDAQGEQRSQGWRRVMTYISSLGGALGTLRKVQSRGTATTGPALAAFTADGRATHRRGQVFGPPEVGKGVRSRRLPTSVRSSPQYTVLAKAPSGTEQAVSLLHQGRRRVHRLTSEHLSPLPRNPNCTPRLSRPAPQWGPRHNVQNDRSDLL